MICQTVFVLAFRLGDFATWPHFTACRFISGSVLVSFNWVALKVQRQTKSFSDSCFSLPRGRNRKLPCSGSEMQQSETCLKIEPEAGCSSSVFIIFKKAFGGCFIYFFFVSFAVDLTYSCQKINTILTSISHNILKNGTWCLFICCAHNAYYFSACFPFFHPKH